MFSSAQGYVASQLARSSLVDALIPDLVLHGAAVISFGDWLWSMGVTGSETAREPSRRRQLLWAIASVSTWLRAFAPIFAVSCCSRGLSRKRGGRFLVLRFSARSGTRYLLSPLRRYHAPCRHLFLLLSDLLHPLPRGRLGDGLVRIMEVRGCQVSPQGFPGRVLR